jgi:hypothetical protein
VFAKVRVLGGGGDLLGVKLPPAVTAPHFPPVWFPPRASDRSLNTLRG